MMLNKIKYPWDYRVEYFQVATTYPCFECGPLSQYQPNWSFEDAENSTSNLAKEIKENTRAYAVFSFPKAISTDQKTFGSYGIFTAYPYSNRYNIGAFGTWYPGTYPSFSSVSSINTKTKAGLMSQANNKISYYVSQGNQTVSFEETLASTRRLRIGWQFPIFLYSTGTSYEISKVYVGTRIYEVALDITPPSFDSLHLRFVPCMKDNVPYICEMHSGTLISNSMSGTVTAGPQVEDKYISWNGGEVT